MKLQYSLDMAEGSFSCGNTPGPQARRLPFHTTAAGRFIAGADYFTEREGMENSFLVFRTLDGRGMLRYRNAECELLPGQAAIIDCAEHQWYGTAPGSFWDFEWVHVGGAAVAEYEERINGGGLRAVMLEKEGAGRIDAAFNAILSLLDGGDGFHPDVLICSRLTEILTELVVNLRHNGGAGGMQRHRGDMEAALECIRGGYARGLGVDEIAGRAHVSKYYFLRMFKAYTGMGPYEYLNNHRVGVAKQLLKATGRTVGDIAQAVGFNDVNCFIRYFKKVTGTTPATFRKYYLY